MYVIRSLPLLCALLSPFSPAAAADTPPAPEWDSVLDGIHASTWRGSSEISTALKKEENRIKQDLPAYISGWERRMAVPILYSGKHEGEGCGPLTYCATDIRNAEKLLARLRERKTPLERLLFERLAPETQKLVTELRPRPESRETAVAGVTGRLVQLLTTDLTRIAATENLYTEANFSGIRLSYPALNLVQEHNDAANRLCVNKTLLLEAFPDEMTRNFKCAVLKDEAYRRVVAARTVQYLRTGDKKSLDAAILLSAKFEDKLMYTDFAFWYHYPRTLADVQAGDAAALTRDAYGFLNDVVLWGDAVAPGSPVPTDGNRRHYTWALADVVLTRGIMAGRMEGLEGLGSAVWLLGYRSEPSPTSDREQELSRLLADLRPLEAGVESDNFRLNYAVALREGQRLQKLLVQALDGGAKGETPEKLFAEARKYTDLAYEWAGTGQGKTIAAASSLELVNLGLTRMKATLPPETYATLVAAEGKADAAAAATLFVEIAAKEKGSGWQQLRFIDRKSYVDGAQRLWNAIRMNSILVGEYYLQKMDRDDFQSVMENAEPAEKALVRYKELFESATAGGHREVVPDSAYFAYAESLKMLSHLKQAVYAYNSSVDLHNQSLTHLLKAISVYPYDDGLSEYADISRRINTNFVTMSPESILSNVMANEVVSRCLEGSGASCDSVVRKTLEWNAVKIKNKLSARKGGDLPGELKGLLRSWKEEAPGTNRAAGNVAKGRSPSGKKNKVEGRELSPARPKMDDERSALLRLSERYLGMAEKAEGEATSASEELGRCTAAGIRCSAVAGAVERLLQRKDELDKAKEELSALSLSFAGTLRAATATTGAGKETDFAARLLAAVNDLYVSEADRLIAVGIKKRLYELRMNEGDPLHRAVRAAFYAGK